MQWPVQTRLHGSHLCPGVSPQLWPLPYSEQKPGGGWQNLFAQPDFAMHVWNVLFVHTCNVWEWLRGFRNQIKTLSEIASPWDVVLHTAPCRGHLSRNVRVNPWDRNPSVYVIITVVPQAWETLLDAMDNCTTHAAGILQFQRQDSLCSSKHQHPSRPDLSRHWEAK